MPAPGPRRMPSAPIAAAVPVAPANQAGLESAKSFGRVDDEGAVYVRAAGGERPVGQYPGATADEALTYFARKYLDLAAQVSLLEQRLAAGAAAGGLRKTHEQLSESLPTAAVVGDIDDLASRLEAAGAAVEALHAAQLEAAGKAKEEALRARTELVEKAEAIAAADPATVQWKSSSAEMAALFEAWKAAQANGPRLSKSDDSALWSRFRKARTTFDKHRREYFSRLDQRNAEAKARKQRLVEEAAALSGSTDWGPTTQEYRRLMDEWKAAPRASRKDDDALWAAFRAAQDVFFQARDAENAQLDAEYRQNLEVKEQLLLEAERLLPIRDVAAAKTALRAIQDKWDAAGKVPRAAMGRVEARLRAVESAVAGAEEDRWKRSNPEVKARADGALSQLDDAIRQLEEKLEKARSRGDAKAIATAEEALSARRAWREQVAKAADDFA